MAEDYTNIEQSDFFDAYIECALWSSIDQDGEPLDKRFDRDDIPHAKLEELRAECYAFIDANIDDIRTFEDGLRTTSRGAQWPVAALIGHDFWLTRNRHGAGFWDRFYGDNPMVEVGARLTAASKVYGGIDLYVSDDGEVVS